MCGCAGVLTSRATGARCIDRNDNGRGAVMEREMPRSAMAMLAATIVALGVAGALTLARAEEGDHPADKPMVVGSDFGVAPWMMRGTQGPEGFGVDLATEIGKRLKRPGVEIVDVNFSALFA